MAPVSSTASNMIRKDLLLLIGFAAAVLTMPFWMTIFGGGYPDLLQRFAIYGLFAIGFNVLFGLTGYLSFGHAAFLGIGSYAAVWSFKLLTMNVMPALFFAIVFSGIFAAAIGYVSLRRTGIYFSILTLAFAQMSYALAYSVLTPITNGETGLQVKQLASEAQLASGNYNPAEYDIRLVDKLFGVEESGIPVTNLFGLKMSGFEGFYFCAVVLIIGFFIAMKISRSHLGLILKGIKANQNRMGYTGFNTRPYTLTAFIISGMYAGLAGGLLAVTDPLAGAERMQWTASGEVVLMTILGGVGTLVGPVLGAALIKYFENIFSAVNKGVLVDFFSFLPEHIVFYQEKTVEIINGKESISEIYIGIPLQKIMVTIVNPFVGEGWHLTLGLLFMVIVIFLPGGLMEGFRRIGGLFRRIGGSFRRKKSPELAGRAAEPAASASQTSS